MAGVKVDPPPVAMSIVDPRTGTPTRPFIEFMHRLWERTGGEVDAIDDIDVTNSFPFFKPLGPKDPEDRQPSFVADQKGASEEQINEAVSNLSSLVAAKAPQPDVLDAIEALKAVTLSNINAARSEIGELRCEVDSLSNLIATIVIPSLPLAKKTI